ncbi:MAG TPA: signal peptidase II [Anaerolineales bacterium]|nr:signal peptidase II [Anaerolineales bacterium]
MSNKRYFTDYLILLSFAAIIVLLDQWSKELIRTNLAYGEIYRPELWLSQYARLIHWRNTGIVFGLFQNISRLFSLLPAIISLGIIYYFPRVPREDRLIRLSMILYLGGGIGNLIDRLTQGYVTDFVSVGNFPVFNIADASISIGVVILALGVFLKEQEEKKLKKAQHTDPYLENDPVNLDTNLLSKGEERE